MILQDAGSEGGILMQFSQVNDLTCQTCAYWRVSKGSFGQCEGKGKKYDGSRKGSACIGWRQVNQSITSPILVKPPERERYNKVEYKSLRKVYNDLHKPKFKATYATNVDGEFITYTSDIHCKNGYYKHRYNYTLIDVALTLFLQGKSFKQVVEHMKGNYMKPMSRRTFREWVVKFLGKDAWNEYYLQKHVKKMKLCAIKDCNKKHHSGGLCKYHYVRTESFKVKNIEYMRRYRKM